MMGMQAQQRQSCTRSRNNRHSDALRVCVSTSLAPSKVYERGCVFWLTAKLKEEGGDYLASVDESDSSLLPGRYNWVNAHPQNREYSTGLNIK